MNCNIYNTLQAKDNNNISCQQNIIPPPNQISQNYEYFQRMPYMNFQMIGNIMDGPKIFPMQEYYFLEPENNTVYNHLENNKYQNDSPVKSVTKGNIVQNENLKNEEKSQDKNNIKDNYIDLLINTIDHLFENGEINMDYINGRNKLKIDTEKLSLALNNISEVNDKNFTKKCDNKICIFLADHPLKLFQAKFFASTSYKPKNLWFCEKCYKAYFSGNYCYYCNTVYREYEYGTQYYDRQKWIQCDLCQKWHHIQCEEKKGKYENIEKLSKNNNFKYICPFCSKHHESIMRQKHKIAKIKKKSILSLKRKNPNEPIKKIK